MYAKQMSVRVAAICFGMAAGTAVAQNGVLIPRRSWGNRFSSMTTYPSIGISRVLPAMLPRPVGWDRIRR